MVTWLAVTLFVSSALLFWVQPMAGKMLLPWLGGAAGVWNVCMVFFQLTLLTGYAYGHLLTSRLRLGAQVGVHMAVMVAGLWALPMVLPQEALAAIPDEEAPVGWLLVVLVAMVGMPFFVVSTTAPLLQRWFSHGQQSQSRDPYFLYAASNAGSLVGLLAYPLILEPSWSIKGQVDLWHMGYVSLMALTAVSGVWVLRQARRKPWSAPLPGTDGQVGASWEDVSGFGRAPAPARVAGAPGIGDALWWTLLAFVPSSLMLGVTTYVATDLASGPMLWVVPLALYLLSFVLVFAPRPVRMPPVAGRVMCLLATALLVAFAVEATQPLWLVLPMHLAVFVVAVMIGHGRLADARPAPAYLTGYFLCISLGGALGGVFNALVAPLLFDRAQEYMLVVALACMVRERAAWERAGHQGLRAFRGVLAPAAVAALTSVVVAAMGWDLGRLQTMAVFGLPAILVYSHVESPRVFGAAFVGLLAMGSYYDGSHGRILYETRNFYSMLRVFEEPATGHRLLVDGNTHHGRERVSQAACPPVSYYDTRGPAGLLFSTARSQSQVPGAAGRVAVIGLGIGALACYGNRLQTWDIYEINPDVVGLARDGRYFRTLADASAGEVRIVLGDARRKLREVPEAHYDLLVVDAFSSDAIPAHLMTLEAWQLYARVVQPRGVLAMNISNRVLELEPVTANLAHRLGWVAYAVRDFDISPEERAQSREASHWVMAARHEDELAFLRSDPRAQRLAPVPGAPLWTDDYSALFSVIRVW